MHLEARLAATARHQHGLLTSRQVRAAGGSADRPARMAATGRWRWVHRGVLAAATAGESPERRALAACLAVGGGAVASHATAAELWGLPVPVDERAHVTTAGGRVVRRAGIVAHRSPLPPMDVDERRGVPATSVRRTIVDCAARLPGDRLAAVVDAAVRRQLLVVHDLDACVAALRPGRGRPLSRFGPVVQRRLRDRHDSDGEAWLHDLLTAAGLPEPVAQHEVVVGGRRRRIDLAYPDERIAVEFDGFTDHSIRTTFDDDRPRQNAIVLAGWTILRFTSASAPDDVVATISEALAQGGRRAS